MSAHPALTPPSVTFDMSALSTNDLKVLRLNTRTRLLIHQNKGNTSLMVGILSDIIAGIDIELASRGETTHG
jgi:hypothetical protein